MKTPGEQEGMPEDIGRFTLWKRAVGAIALLRSAFEPPPYNLDFSEQDETRTVNMNPCLASPDLDRAAALTKALILRKL